MFDMPSLMCPIYESNTSKRFQPSHPLKKHWTRFHHSLGDQFFQRKSRHFLAQEGTTVPVFTRICGRMFLHTGNINLILHISHSKTFANKCGTENVSKLSAKYLMRLNVGLESGIDNSFSSINVPDPKPCSRASIPLATSLPDPPLWTVHCQAPSLLLKLISNTSLEPALVWPSKELAVNPPMKTFPEESTCFFASAGNYMRYVQYWVFFWHVHAKNGQNTKLEKQNCKWRMPGPWTRHIQVYDRSMCHLNLDT